MTSELIRTGRNWQSYETDQNWQSTSQNFNYSHWPKLTVNAIELIRTGRNWQTPSSNFTRTDQTRRVNAIEIYSYWPKADHATSSNSFTCIDNTDSQPHRTLLGLTEIAVNVTELYPHWPNLSQRYWILAKTVNAIELTSWRVLLSDLNFSPAARPALTKWTDNVIEY